MTTMVIIITFRTYEYSYKLNPDKPLTVSNNESEFFIPILIHDGKVIDIMLKLVLGLIFQIVSL